MSGIGLITNPKSRKNRRDPGIAMNLAYLLGERGDFATPSDLGALADTVRRFADADIDLLCVNGGDGTVHQAMTALLRVWPAGRPLPRVAVLPGGTMNIVANSIGVKGDAGRALGRVLDAYHAGRVLPSTRRRLLRVDLPGEPPVYGFLSGNGIIARFLEVYYAEPDPSPAVVARLLARGVASTLVGGRFARKLTQPYVGRVALDGVDWPGTTWTAVAIGTVEQIGLGFTPFYRVREEPDRMHVVGIGGTIVDLARELPSIYLGRGIHQPGNREGTCATLLLEADGDIPMMVDGDFYPAKGRAELRVDAEVELVLP